MIITKEVTMFIQYKYADYYNKLGYDVKGGEKEIILVNHLSPNSHAKIDVLCDICGNKKSITYQDYNNKIKYDGKYYCSKCGLIKYKKIMLEKYGAENPMFLDKFKNKLTETNIKKYGVKYPSQNKTIYNKTKSSFIKKYGVEYISQSEYWRNKIGFSGDINEFYKYKRLVKNLTNNIKNKLFENWDGYDYYDKEYIKDYLNLHYNDKKYPTIDHKTSILYGYKNNISIKTISNIDNLCITKRSINSSMKKLKCLNDIKV